MPNQPDQILEDAELTPGDEAAMVEVLSQLTGESPEELRKELDEECGKDTDDTVF